MQLETERIKLDSPKFFAIQTASFINYLKS